MCMMHEIKKTMTFEAIRGMGIKNGFMLFLVRSRELVMTSMKLEYDWLSNVVCGQSPSGVAGSL